MKKKSKKAKKSARVSKKDVSVKRGSGKKKAAKKVQAKKRQPTRSGKSAKQRRQRNTAYPEPVTPRSGAQSGDLQGLDDVESADSESVGELLEEGNAFEADVVAGVERADAEDERGVRTREVPEDDVPEEYLDEK